MIYRFGACSLLGSLGLLLLLATGLTNRMAQFSRRRVDANTFWATLIGASVNGPVLLGLAVVLSIASVGFLWPGIAEFFSTGKVHMHWSRLLAGSFSLLSLFQVSIFFVLVKVTDVWQEQQAAHERLAIGARTTVSNQAEECVDETSVRQSRVDAFLEQP